MFITFAISLALMCLSGLLIDSHRRSWRAARQNDDLPARDRRYAQSQYRRRMQASSIIGVLGAAIAIYPLIPREPGPMAFYLASLVSACACIMLLAFLDAWATRQHYRRLLGERLTAEIKLATELRSARETADADG